MDLNVVELESTDIAGQLVDRPLENEVVLSPYGCGLDCPDCAPFYSSDVPTIPELGPHYQAFITIPQNGHNTELFDAKSIANDAGNVEAMRMVYLMDSSSNHPFVLTIWNEFMHKNHELLYMWSQTWNVLGITSLCPSSLNGFSLTHTKTTAIIQIPKGAKARKFHDWVEANKSLLANERHNYTATLAQLKRPAKLPCRPLEFVGGYYTCEAPNSGDVPVLEAHGPCYQSIATIPVNASPDDVFDLLGIIVFISEPRYVGVSHMQVRDVYISDYSCECPLKVTLTAYVLCSHMELIMQRCRNWTVIGITAVVPSSSIGLSMRETLGTRIIVEPDVIQTTTLHAWAGESFQDLINQKAELKHIYSPTGEPMLTMICALKWKTARNTLQDIQYVFEATMPDVSINAFHAYLACVRCSKCDQEDVAPIARAYLQATVVDKTDLIALSFISEHVEVLFGKSAKELLALYQQESRDCLLGEIKALRSKKLTIRIRPTLALSIQSKLRWSVLSVLVA